MGSCLQVVCCHIFFIWFLRLSKWKAELRSGCRVFALPCHSFVRWHLKCFSGSHLEAVSPAGVSGMQPSPDVVLLAFGVPGWQRCISVWEIILGFCIIGPCPAWEIFSSFLSNPCNCPMMAHCVSYSYNGFIYYLYTRIYYSTTVK